MGHGFWIVSHLLSGNLPLFYLVISTNETCLYVFWDTPE